MIFERLCRVGELTVRRLTDGSGISQPAISKHLRMLRNAGLVEGRREGRSTHYRAVPDRLAPLEDWTSEMRAFWRTRLDELDELLKRMDN